MRVWIGRGGAVLLGVGLLLALLGMLSRSDHDPNHDIDLEKARAAARRVHTPPDPRVQRELGAGG